MMGWGILELWLEEDAIHIHKSTNAIPIYTTQISSPLKPLNEKFKTISIFSLAVPIIYLYMFTTNRLKSAEIHQINTTSYPRAV
jgi:hypothetical protein